MCDAFINSYAAQLNGSPDRTADNPGLIPTIVLFSGTDCTGQMYPTTEGVIGNKDYSTKTTLPFTVKSFYVPFNYSAVTFTAASNSLTLNGPFIGRDVSLLAWNKSFNSQTLDGLPPQYVQGTPLDYEQEVVFPGCMGKHQILENSLLRYLQPQTAYCDDYMENKHCTLLLSSDECSCFRELLFVEKLSEQVRDNVRINFPVICFGPDCATKRSYKTLAMVQDPCNLILCRSTIKETPGIFNDSQDQVFCGGQYYTESTPISIPSAIPLPSPQPVQNGNEKSAPFYIWIMIGISALLFMLLIYLFFTAPPSHKASLMRQLGTLRKDIKMYQNKQQSKEQQPVDVTTGDNFLFS